MDQTHAGLDVKEPQRTADTVVSPAIASLGPTNTHKHKHNHKAQKAQPFTHEQAHKGLWQSTCEI